MRRGLVLLAVIVAAAAWPPGAAGQGTFSGCSDPPAVTAAIPADAAAMDQADVNCFAWQQFIALNWPADPSTCAADPTRTAAEFGEPGDTAPAVWETYASPAAVFLPDAAEPAGWCSPAGGTKRLSRLSKFSPATPLALDDVDEAEPSTAWLTAQSGTLTLYEIRMNEDEFTYIVENTLYDADKQEEAASGPGISLPDGSDGGTGAIELKAAWLELDDPADASRYKTARAAVTYPGQQPKTVTVGLVGLHIIHKTRLAQQFVWATFEHVDNAPSTEDISNGTLRPKYTYYDHGCDPSNDHYKCRANATPLPTRDPYDAPVQVVRENPLDSGPENDIEGLNQVVWKEIGDANPDSVYLNYQLVNVLWPNSSSTIPPGSRVPLTPGDPQPEEDEEAVTNTTLETYVQSNTCLDCHVHAPIAATGSPTPLLNVDAPADPANTPYASDYSFVFMRAQVKPGGAGTTPWLIAAAGVAGAGAVAVVATRRRRRST